MARGLVFALCLSGCLKEAKFEYRDAGVPEDSRDAATPVEPVVTAATLGTGASITGGQFRVVFSSTGSHMPGSILIGGTEMVGRAQACNAERGIGIGLFPTLLINDEVQPGAAQSVPAVPSGFAGPLVAQVVVPFSHMRTCNATSGEINGTSTFTAFPDGRVVRHDNIQVTGNLDSTMCPTCMGSPSDANFYLTSFATLRANDGGSVVGADVSALTTGNEILVPSESTFCASYMDRQLTMSFLSDGAVVGHRVRAVASSPRTLAFVHDILRNSPDLTSAASRNISTPMLLGRDGTCTADHARARTLSMRPRIDFGPPDGLDLLAPGFNGIYGNSTNGPLDRAPGPIVFSPEAMDLPGGFVFWLELGAQNRAQTTITHSNPAKMTPNWVRTQDVEATQLILYFRDPLLLGETITITPGPLD